MSLSHRFQVTEIARTKVLSLRMSKSMTKIELNSKIQYKTEISTWHSYAFLLEIKLYFKNIHKTWQAIILFQLKGEFSIV